MVTGFKGVCPEQKIKFPDCIAAEYGPIAFGAFSEIILFIG
jgi:hypothetical protein